MSYIGSQIRRKEDPRLLTGRSEFVDDVQRPHMLHCGILRSPHAHARIKNIDYSSALERPSVRDVLTFDRLEGAIEPIPVRLAHLDSLQEALQYPLASDRVRYVGEPMAVVVAESRYLAEDALDDVKVEFDPLTPRVDVDDARGGDPPLLHESLPDNVVAEFSAQAGDVEQGFRESDGIFEETFYTQRHSGIPLETRGLVAEYHPGREVLTVWGPTKVPHFNRQVLSDLLDMPPSRIRFIEPDVGGGFGIRGEFYPEDFLVPYLARRLGRPVKWIEDRREHFLSANHSREQRHEVKVGYREDGIIQALYSRLYNDQGAYVRTHGVTVPNLSSALMPGPYKLPHYRCDVTCVLTNKTPTGTYRGPGRFEVNFVRERVVRRVADEVGMDPAEVRRRNLVPADDMPYEVGTQGLGEPVVYDSGDYPDTLEKTLTAFEYESWKERQAEALARDRYVGVGLGYFVEKTGLGPFEWGRVHVDEKGQITVFTGATHVGQGIETALSQICADVLDADIDRVSVVHGDTDRVPYGIGSFASRSAVMAGNATRQAALDVVDKMKRLAARNLEVGVEDLELQQEGIRVKGAPSRGLSFRELAALSSPEQDLPQGMDPGLEAQSVFRVNEMTYAHGIHAAAVEVDVETGQIDILRYLIAYDVGRAINPMIVRGQIEGGMAQGIGGSLLEELAYDGDGQLLTTSFMDYLIPTASETPDVEVLLLEDSPTPLNPLGVKGTGEGGTVGASGALPNAVMDALSPLDPEPITRLPVTPERVLRSIGKLSTHMEGSA